MTSRFAALFLLCAAVIAGAQEPVHRYEFPTALSADTRAQLTRLADSARAVGLPTDPIVAKAAEGVLKGADEARILAAVRALSAQLADAATVLPGNTTPGTLTAAASALRAGVTADALRELSRNASGGSDADLGNALVTVADLAAGGVQTTRAVSAVGQLLRLNASEREFAALRASVAADIQRGVAPESALSERMATVVRRLGPPSGPPGTSPGASPPDAREQFDTNPF